MNIFKEFEDLLGRVDVASFEHTLREFFNLAAEIRGKLGARAYMLDKYISYLLEVANKTSCSEAADDGYSAAGPLRGICIDAVRGGDARREHPLYEKVVGYLSSHPIEFQEDITKANILYIAMLDEYMNLLIEEYVKQQSYKLQEVLDTIHLQQLYRQISDIIGDETLMERLNLAIRQRFFAVPVMSAFIQGLTNDLLYCLTHRDMETSKQMFQLVFDQFQGE